MALSSLPVADVVAAAAEPAQALARHCGVALTLAGDSSGEQCLCDRTLAKQAVLSSLGTVLGRRPRFVTLASGGTHREPRVEIGIGPALPAAEVEAMVREMSEPQALMQAQGGALAVSYDGRARASRCGFRSAPRRWPLCWSWMTTRGCCGSTSAT